MSIIKTLFSLLGNDEKDPEKPKDSAQEVSVTTCSRHPLRKAAGKCRYCERDLCSDCLTPKNDFLNCVNMVDCFNHIKDLEIGKAERVRKMFREFVERPNFIIIRQITDAVRDANDPEITDVILESFSFESTNLGAYGLAIHCLGLVKDPRALHLLTMCFDALSNLDAFPQNTRLSAICADHLRRSAQAILHVVSADGQPRDETIAAIKRIVECEYLPLDIRIRANDVLLGENGAS